jgi:hypothetical protein
MPQSATLDAIKAHQENVEKDKITSEGLPACPRCQLEAIFFKIHAYRERRFLVIIKAIVLSVYCTLVRFRCPRCKKTLTHYPDFAMPYKHYTRQPIESFSRTYIEEEHKTYETAVMTEDGTPSYSNSGRSLAGPTIYRWISAIALIFTSGRDRYYDPNFAISKRKYRSPERKENLLKCLNFLRLNPI